MRVISKSRLLDYGKRHHDSGQELLVWYALVSRLAWANPDDVRADFPQTSIVKGIHGVRAVFRFGHRIRLIAAIHFLPQHPSAGRVYIRWVGTHAEYDRVDASRI